MSLLKSLLIRGSGNRMIQSLLEKTVLASQDLMGIGCGGDVSSSGEHAIFQLLKQGKHPPYTIFDVGSNQGQFIHLIMKNVAAEDCSIHCFEPCFETFKILEKVSRDYDNIKLNRIGLGKEKGEAFLYYDIPGSGLASMTKRDLHHFGIDFGKSEKVSVSTIDDYCAGSFIDCIDLLKIDIEGHELDALSGAEGMFSSGSIRIVSFEFGGCNIDTRSFFQDFWRFFYHLGFNLYRITPSGFLQRLFQYKEVYEQFRTTNFIAVSPDTPTPVSVAPFAGTFEGR